MAILDSLQGLGGTVVSFLSPYKWIILGIVLSTATSSILWWGHTKYEAGKAACELVHSMAQVSYLKEEAPFQVAQADKAATTIAEAGNKKLIHKQEAHDEAIKASRPLSCDLTDGELLLYQQAVKDANQ